MAISRYKFKLPTKGTRRRRLKSDRTRLTSLGDPNAPPSPDGQRPDALHDVAWRVPSFSELLAFLIIVSVFAIIVATATCPGEHMSLPKGPTDQPAELVNGEEMR